MWSGPNTETVFVWNGSAVHRFADFPAAAGSQTAISIEPCNAGRVTLAITERELKPGESIAFSEIVPVADVVSAAGVVSGLTVRMRITAAGQSISTELPVQVLYLR